MLERLGYTVLESRNCTEATALCEQANTEVSLLLVEIRRENIRLEAKLREQRPSLRVLYLSSASRIELAENGAPVLKKPFTMHEIADAVHNALNPPEERVMSAGHSG